MQGICKNCKKEFRKRTSKYVFCSLKCSNNFNRNGLKRVVLPLESPELAEFVGICLGDGHASRYQVTVSLNSIVDRKYVIYVTNLMTRLFKGPKITVLKRKNLNMLDVKLNSVLVAEFMRKNGVVPNNKYVPKWINKKQPYINFCLRGLFDTEGSISFKIYKAKKGISLYKQLNFRNANLGLMRFVRDNLLQQGFNPTNTLKQSLYLSNHESVNDFVRLIGFSNPKLISKSNIVNIDQYENLAKINPELFGGGGGIRTHASPFKGSEV